MKVNQRDLRPKSTGTLVGIASTLGTAAGVLGNIISGIVLDLTQSWTLVFFIYCRTLVFGRNFFIYYLPAIKIPGLKHSKSLYITGVIYRKKCVFFGQNDILQTYFIYLGIICLI